MCDCDLYMCSVCGSIEQSITLRHGSHTCNGCGNVISSYTIRPDADCWMSLGKFNAIPNTSPHKCMCCGLVYATDKPVLRKIGSHTCIECNSSINSPPILVTSRQEYTEVIKHHKSKNISKLIHIVRRGDLHV